MPPPHGKSQPSVQFWFVKEPESTPTTQLRVSETDAQVPAGVVVEYAVTLAPLAILPPHGRLHVVPPLEDELPPVEELPPVVVVVVVEELPPVLEEPPVVVELPPPVVVLLDAPLEELVIPPVLEEDDEEEEEELLTGALSGVGPHIDPS